MMKFPGFRRWKTWPLATQILLVMITILVLTVSIGGVLYSNDNSQTLQQQYELRALSIASSVAKTPSIITALQTGDPHGDVATMAEQFMQATGAAYVVVANRDGIRFSHPNPALIGKRLEEGVIALDGKTHVRVNEGSLGTSANGIAPVFSDRGVVVGEVSVGILETKLDSQLALDLRTIIGYSILILLFSVLGSILLARRIKRVTFGLEPASIASLLREREALLHGIKEGMLALDTDDRVTVVNEEATRLLGLGPNVVGQKLSDIVPDGRLLDVLSGQIRGTDEVIVTDEYLLAVNHMRVELGGRNIGSVVTVRDRTEVEGLVRELHAISGLTDALRAQEHEYANRLYVITGLIEMGEYDEVSAYLAQASNTPSSIARGLKTRIETPRLAALLLAKITVAAEQQISLIVTEDSHLSASPAHEQILLTIVGNLIDNAIDAVSPQEGIREIVITLHDEHGVRVVVRDNGPGIPEDHIDDVLLDGYSTKPSRPGTRRGLGLAIVSRLVFRAGGTIAITSNGGASFEVTLPDRSHVRERNSERRVEQVG